MKINRSLLTNFNPDNDVTFYQNVTAESLSGTGTRMVVANSAGLLSTQAIPSGTIGGSGTANYIPKFATGTSLGNSVIYENSSNIGINNTNPLHKLHITQAADGNYPTLGTGKGAIFVAGDTNLYGLYVGINTTFGDAWLQAMRNNTATAYNLILQPAGGNVLVNQTTDSGERLQVTGSVKITSNLVVDTDTLYVDATNNRVGIGTASPSEKLEVNGNIKTSSPSGGTAKPWKLGAAASATGDTQNTKIEVEIDGVLYYLIAYTV